MTEHQSEIFLTHLSTIAVALTRIAEAMSTERTRTDLAGKAVKEETSPNEARKRATDTTEERPATTKVQSDLSYDELASRLAGYSRDLDPGLFSKFMKGTILPKYAADGGGLSSINPEHFDDILAECTDFYEAKKEGEGAYQ